MKLIKPVKLIETNEEKGVVESITYYYYTVYMIYLMFLQLKYIKSSIFSLHNLNKLYSLIKASGRFMVSNFNFLLYTIIQKKKKSASQSLFETNSCPSL